MTPPRVTVIIPCYNLGPYVDEAVASVLAQTYQAFEIVIVNDGSTDDATNSLLAAYRRPKTIVISTENRGLAGARNLGIAHSSGEYLCALDADDALEPTYFERAVARLDQDPTLTFVSSWLETFGDEQWQWKPDRCDLPAVLAECTVCTAALVRRKAVLAAGGYDGAMPAAGYEDWDLWLSILERGGRGEILPEILFRYRRRSGSMSTVCCVGETHLSLMEYLFRKHETSYRTHLTEVLRRKDADTAALLRSNDESERHLHGWLVPEVARRREEVARLTRKVTLPDRQRAQAADDREHAARAAALEREIASTRTSFADHEMALRRAEDEVDALRASLSWRLTGPLRAGYGWMRRIRRRR